MTARSDVLARIRSALTSGSGPGTIARTYRTTGDHPPGSPAALDLLVDRLEDYRATVRRAAPGKLALSIEAALGASRSVVVPDGLDASWQEACRTDGRRVVVDGKPTMLSAYELDEIDAVVTGCHVAVADTGTIVLDAGVDQGRRVLTLVPDRHVCVVRADQVVHVVPEALARLDPTRPLTMISGPSATSDIELQRVEGVHGPRTLEVILVS